MEKVPFSSLLPCQQEKIFEGYQEGKIPTQPITILKTSDDFAGNKFGEAKKRKGKCLKIGSGGRNKSNWNPYQLWVSWAECDLD